MKISHCDKPQLDRFLSESLNALEEQALQQHLETCLDCRASLEAMAAPKGSWDAVRSLLSGDIEAVSTSTGLETERRLPRMVRQVIEMLGPTDQPASLGKLDGYEVVGVVGYGAMGIVLKAHDSVLDRILAIKVLSPTLAGCGAARQRFFREARAAAAVHHPNVVPIHGVSDPRTSKFDLPYLLMPYLGGESLQDRFRREGALTLAESLRIGFQLAAGLSAAHQQGLIHRDVKPSNVVLAPGAETALLTDFGLARAIDDATMTRTGTIAGTPEYMSPEQARGEVVGFGSDLFSLGSVLYTVATGRPPFRAQTTYGLLRRINEQTPVGIRELNPDYPSWFCRVVERLMHKDASARPSADQTRQWLEQCLAHCQQPDRILLPEAFWEVGQRRIPRRLSIFQWGVVMMGMLFVVATFGIMFNGIGLNEAPPVEGNALGAVGSVDDEREVFRSLKRSFPDPQSMGKLVIDINRGSIDVVVHDQDYVVIEILKPQQQLGKPGDAGLVKQFLPQFDFREAKADNSIKLDTYNQDYRLDLRIRVPRKVNLTLDAYRDGFLKVKGVEGNVYTHSQHSDITLTKISGTATAYSYNGDIQVELLKVTPTAKLDYESYNGSLDITLPKDLSASLAISTGVGQYQTGFMMDEVSDRKALVDRFKTKALTESELESYQLSTVNGGGVPVRLETTKGEIRIRRGGQE